MDNTMPDFTPVRRDRVKSEKKKRLDREQWMKAYIVVSTLAIVLLMAAAGYTSYTIYQIKQNVAAVDDNVGTTDKDVQQADQDIQNADSDVNDVCSGLDNIPDSSCY